MPPPQLLHSGIKEACKRVSFIGPELNVLYLFICMCLFACRLDLITVAMWLRKHWVAEKLHSEAIWSSQSATAPFCVWMIPQSNQLHWQRSFPIVYICWGSWEPSIPAYVWNVWNEFYIFKEAVFDNTAFRVTGVKGVPLSGPPGIPLLQGQLWRELCF